MRGEGVSGSVSLWSEFLAFQLTARRVCEGVFSRFNCREQEELMSKSRSLRRRSICQHENPSNRFVRRIPPQLAPKSLKASDSLSCGEEIIESEVIEFVIKIVLRGIFDFHLESSSWETSWALFRVVFAQPPNLCFLLWVMFTQSFAASKINCN